VYDYALATGGSLNLVNWGTAIAGNVFSNSSIQLKGNEVAGVVKACGAIDVTDSQMPTFNIEPNQPLPLTMPVVNWDYSSHNSDTYKYSAGTTYIVRDLEIQNSIVNKIVYVFGNVQLPVAIPGNTLIVASGDIHIQGDSTLTMPKAGLIAGNNIYIEGPEQQDPSDESSQQDTGPEIHGLLLAGNNVITSGVSTIWGTVVAGNHFLPGKDRHVIYQDADAVEWVFQFVESVGRTRKDIIANYDDLNKSYLVTPAKKPGAEIENNHTTPDSHSTTGSSAGVPPEITIIRWKELN
jgi:cytoskeletal protein CcmA (bactofilin family)